MRGVVIVTAQFTKLSDHSTIQIDNSVKAFLRTEKATNFPTTICVIDKEAHDAKSGSAGTFSKAFQTDIPQTGT
jgi:hypothetical protein